MSPLHKYTTPKPRLLWISGIITLLLCGGVTSSAWRQAQGANLTLNQPAVASSAADSIACPNCSADKAVDGNSSTRWGNNLRSEPEPTPTAFPIYKDPDAAVPDRVADLLSRMTLAEKIGQMTQVERSALQNEQHIAAYALGSLLSGGGSTPGTNTPSIWADMVDGYQTIAVPTRLGLLLI
jgi:hypothetical protein